MPVSVIGALAKSIEVKLLAVTSATIVETGKGIVYNTVPGAPPAPSAAQTTTFTVPVGLPVVANCKLISVKVTGAA